jgi:hypothetical protein
LHDPASPCPRSLVASPSNPAKHQTALDKVACKSE